MIRLGDPILGFVSALLIGILVGWINQVASTPSFGRQEGERRSAATLTSVLIATAGSFIGFYAMVDLGLAARGSVAPYAVSIVGAVLVLWGWKKAAISQFANR